MYAQVAMDIASDSLAKAFTYRVPSGLTLEPGTRVRVPFGRSVKAGYVLSLTDTSEYDQSKLKDILEPIEPYPMLPPPLMALAHEMADKGHYPLCEALRLMIPGPLRGGDKPKTQTVAEIAIGGDALERALDALERAPKRRRVLKLLSDGVPRTLEELNRAENQPREALKALQAQGLVRLTERALRRAPYARMESDTREHEPTPTQEEALSELLPALRKGKGQFLLHGVTGSGKTEVYIRLVREALNMGKGAIVLVPEIVLTPQMTAWFRGRFGDTAAVLHSRLSDGERADEWRRVRMGEARVAIGARSAIFAPVENLGAIIVDEEHEQSYVSDRHPRYDARDVAASRCAREHAMLLLASATPSMLSFARARRGDMMLLEMPTRVCGRPLPEVTVVDMREELRLGNRSMFSALLQQKLLDCVRSGDQAMLFLNRRGYAAFANCRRCGYVVKCDACDVSMTYHQPSDSLHCHYCGASRPMPEACPECGAKALKLMGVGTQRVEEEVRALLPGVPVARMDVDTTRARGAQEALLESFKKGETRVLVGTQMIAKGLDFPAVTLVGAVLADMTLHLPDFRSAERTFQLITQVAGRAGRGSQPGHVVVQTYNPDHIAIQCASRQDFRAFFEGEFERRKRELYPPFTMMVRLLCEHPDAEIARQVCEELGDQVEAFLLDHPALKRRALLTRVCEAPVKRIRGKARWHMLMKLLCHPDGEAVLAYLSALSEAEYPCAVYLEVNPASLM